MGFRLYPLFKQTNALVHGGRSISRAPEKQLAARGMLSKKAVGQNSWNKIKKEHASSGNNWCVHIRRFSYVQLISDWDPFAHFRETLLTVCHSEWLRTDRANHLLCVDSCFVYGCDAPAATKPGNQGFGRTWQPTKNWLLVSLSYNFFIAVTRRRVFQSTDGYSCLVSLMFAGTA